MHVQALLSEFVGDIVCLHSYSYSPIAVHAKYGGHWGEITGRLIVLSGDRMGEEVSVYAANRQVVLRVKKHLLGNFDGPMYGLVDQGPHHEILFKTLDPTVEALYRAVVRVEPQAS